MTSKEIIDSGIYYYECPICNVPFTSSDFKREHYLESFSGYFHCSKCNEDYFSIHRFENIITVHKRGYAIFEDKGWEIHRKQYGKEINQMAELNIDDFLSQGDFTPHKMCGVKHVYKPVCRCYMEGEGEDAECMSPNRTKKVDEYGFPENPTIQDTMICDECLHCVHEVYASCKADHTIKKCIKGYPEGYVDPRNGRRYTTREAFRLVRKANRRK